MNQRRESDDASANESGPVPSKQARQEVFRACMAQRGANAREIVEAASLFQGVKPGSLRVYSWPKL